MFLILFSERPVGVLFDIYVTSSNYNEKGVPCNDNIPWEITVHNTGSANLSLNFYEKKDILFLYRSTLKEVYIYLINN